MLAVEFPTPQFRIKSKGEKRYIFDVIRKKWLVLTEEEWVRQNIIAYLTTVLHFPKQTIAVEKGMLVNGLRKRFDVLVYDNAHKPFLMAECKAPEIILNEDVLQQVLRYNIAVPVTWIVLTNGRKTIAWKKENDQLKLVEHLPAWEEVCKG